MNTESMYTALGITPAVHRFGEEVLAGLRARFDEIDRVVHIQLVHDLFELGVRKAADEQLLLLGLHFDECFRRQLLRQQPEKERHCFFT